MIGCRERHCYSEQQGALPHGISHRQWIARRKTKCHSRVTLCIVSTVRKPCNDPQILIPRRIRSFSFRSPAASSSRSPRVFALSLPPCLSSREATPFYGLQPPPGLETRGITEPGNYCGSDYHRRRREIIACDVSAGATL